MLCSLVRQKVSEGLACSTPNQNILQTKPKLTKHITNHSSYCHIPLNHFSTDLSRPPPKMSPFDLFTNLLIGACFTVNTILLYESKTSFLCYMWKPLLKHPKRILLTAAYINLIIMCCIMQQYYSSTFLPIEIIDPKTDKNIGKSWRESTSLVQYVLI